MVSALFHEIEEIELPNGEKYEVLPLDVEGYELLWDTQAIMRTLNDKKRAMEKKKVDKKKIAELNKDSMLKALPMIKKLIPQSIKNTESGEPLDSKYINARNYIELYKKVLLATDPETKFVKGNSKDGETPLDPKNIASE
jgi:hypothetical protein